MLTLNTWGLDDERFMIGIRDLVSGTTFSTTFGSLVAILAPCVEKHIPKVTTAMAALEDVEGRCYEAGAEVSMQ